MSAAALAGTDFKGILTTLATRRAKKGAFLSLLHYKVGKNKKRVEARVTAQALARASAV